MVQKLRVEGLERSRFRKGQWINSTEYADFLRWYDGSEGCPRPGRSVARGWHPQAPLFDTRVKLPLIVWHVLSRIGWWFNHPSQPADQHVLIVTHGFLMYVLRRELTRSGFAGQIPTHPQCGEVYMFDEPTESRAPVHHWLRSITLLLPRPVRSSRSVTSRSYTPSALHHRDRHLRRILRRVVHDVVRHHWLGF